MNDEAKRLLTEAADELERAMDAEVAISKQMAEAQLQTRINVAHVIGLLRVVLEEQRDADATPSD